MKTLESVIIDARNYVIEENLSPRQAEKYLRRELYDIGNATLANSDYKHLIKLVVPRLLSELRRTYRFNAFIREDINEKYSSVRIVRDNGDAFDLISFPNNQQGLYAALTLDLTRPLISSF